MWGPARVSGQGHERYFLLVVDDYSRYTTVFPLRRKDRGGEFSSDLLRAFCRAEGIRQTFTLPASPQENGIAERRIGMPETTPTLRWTGKVGDASVFRVWGSRAFVRDSFADKLSSRADVTFDESVSYYRLFPYCTAFLPPPPLFLAPGAPPRVEPGGAEPGGAESGVAEPGGAEPERAESGGSPGVPSRREPLSPQRLREWYARRCRRAAGATRPAVGGASGAGAAGGAAGAGAAGATGPGGASAGGIGAVGGGPTGVGAAGGASGAGAAGGAAGARAGAGGTSAVGGPAGVGATGGAGAAGPGGARTGGTGAAGAGGAAGVGAVGAGAAGGTGAGGAAGVVAGDPGAEGTGAVSAISGGAARPRPYYVPLLQQPASPLPGPSSYSGLTRGLTEPEFESRPASRPASPESRPESPVRPVRTGRRRVPLPSPPVSSLPALADPEPESLHTASPTVTRFLATAVTDPLFESTAASALVAELVEFAAHCRLDYAASLVAESESASVCPPSVGGECALGTDVLEDQQEEFECFATAVPHLMSMLLAPEGDPDAIDIPSTRSYAEAIEGPYSS
ncbi:unnamed protein product [Closterium sp. NIES-53]